MSAFQEYDCPRCGHDHDRNDEQIVMAGERFECSGCGASFLPSEVGLTQTAIPTAGPGPDGEDRYFTFRSLPTSLAEKADWIAEGRRNQAIRDGVSGSDHQTLSQNTPTEGWDG